MKKNVMLFLSLFLPFLVFSQASLNSISPNSAYAMKVLDVTITGNNTHFNTSNGTAVKFGFDQGTGTAVINKTTIVDQTTIITNITVPYATIGKYDVAVTNSTDGTIVLPNSFSIISQPTPSLVSVSPASANTGQTLTLKLIGDQTDFTSATGLTVSLDLKGPGTPNNMINSSSNHVINDTTLEATFTIPSSIFTGDYNILVSSNYGYIYLQKGFHVNGLPAPTLTSVNPTSGNAGQTLNVTITGNETHFKQGNKTKVTFGFNQATSTTSVNSISITNDSQILANITVPANQPTGNYDVYVEDSVDDVILLPKAFNVVGAPVPVLLSASPDSSIVGKTLDVTITGSNTHFQQAGTTAVSFMFNQATGTIVVNSTTALSETTLKANITIPSNAISGYYDIRTSNLVDGPLTLPKGFNITGVPIASLVSITPATGNIYDSLKVTITGVNTHFTQSNNQITFNFKSATSSIQIVSSSVIDDQTLTANIAIAPVCVTGDYSVYVKNATDGYLALINAFHVNGVAPPSIISVNPAEVRPGQKLDVTITGAKTHFKNTGTTVSFDFKQASGTAVVNSLTEVDDTMLIANITVPQNISPGNYLVSVYNSLDGPLLYYNFKVGEGCHVFYSTSYTPATNVFTLALDSLTSNATSFHWDFGDGTTSNDKLPEHTFTQDKLYNVCLQIVNASGDTCSYCHVMGKDSLGNPVFKVKGFSTKVVPYVPVVTGITEEPVTGEVIRIYPNPANDILHIATYNLVRPDESPLLSIYSIEGKLMLQKVLSEQRSDINIQDFAKGMYILELRGEESTKRMKFMKQ